MSALISVNADRLLDEGRAVCERLPRQILLRVTAIKSREHGA
jgi:hypothetical protein